MFLETSQNSQGNTSAGVSFFNKVGGLDTLTQVFSCGFYRTPPVAASKHISLIEVTTDGLS